MSKIIKKHRKLIEKLPFLILLISVAFLGLSHYLKDRERQIAVAAPAEGEVILFWDGATDAPAGWSCISCLATDPYYEKFPMGTSTYGASSTATHTHTMTFAVGNSAGIPYDDGTVINHPPAVHNHTASGGTITATTALPAYYQLKVIKKLNPTEIPAGVIAIFDTTSLPGNWELFSDADGKIIRGGPSTSSVSSAHTHTGVGFTLDNFTGACEAAKSVAGVTGEACVHGHTYSGGTTDPADSLPPYIDVVLAKVTTATTSLPNGIIAMFDATLPENWAAVSAINSDRFLRASSTGYGGTGGSTSHDHPNKNYIAPATADTINDADLSPPQNGALVGHTHTVTVDFGSATNIPPYLGTIFAKYTPAPSVTCDFPLADTNATTSFSTLTTSAVATSTPNATNTVSSNCPMQITIYDAGNGVNAGLFCSACSGTPDAKTIGSADENYAATSSLSQGVEGYGIIATTTGSNLNINPRFLWNPSGTIVGGLATTTIDFASSTAAVPSQVMTIYHKAAVSGTNLAGNYTDQITYTCSPI